MAITLCQDKQESCSWKANLYAMIQKHNCKFFGHSLLRGGIHKKCSFFDSRHYKKKNDDGGVHDIHVGYSNIYKIPTLVHDCKILYF